MVNAGAGFVRGFVFNYRFNFANKVGDVMPRCDICHKRSPYVHELLNIYKTDEIEDVCDDCNKIINKQLSKIKSVTAKITIDLFKNYMKSLIKR